MADEGGQREDDLLSGGVVGDLAVERREVRGAARLVEQAEEARALMRALFGLVGCRELGPVGLVIAHVRDTNTSKTWDSRLPVNFKAHHLSQSPPSPQLGKGSGNYVWQWCGMWGIS